MSQPTSKGPIRIIIATVVIIAAVGWLAFTGIRDNKSYYVTIGEMRQMGDKAYTRHLRVGGFVAPGSIHRNGPNVVFQLTEQTADNVIPECKTAGPNCVIEVSYQGTEPPPDTFKDEAQALAVGTYGKDGVFHATQLQAKCASKYAPAAPGATPNGMAKPTTTASALPPNR
jgi:cytochrome c-type biogenesis protein CcmE